MKIFNPYKRLSMTAGFNWRETIEHIHSIDYYHIEDEHGHKHEYRAHERKKADPDERYNRRRFYRGGCWGIITNSLALVSDAGHMLTHLFALLVSLFALFFASRPPTEKRRMVSTA